MKAAVGALLMVAAAGCTVPAAAGGEEIPLRGTGKICNAAPAQRLIGKARSEAVGKEAIRLSGAGALRWIPEDSMVTMDFREDRLNIHLDAKNKVVRIACG